MRSGNSSPNSHGRSGHIKLQKMAEEEEEKKFGVDHFDDDIKNTGNSHCLQAYLNFRADAKPMIMS